MLYLSFSLDSTIMLSEAFRGLFPENSPKNTRIYTLIGQLTGRSKKLISVIC